MKLIKLIGQAGPVLLNVERIDAIAWGENGASTGDSALVYIGGQQIIVEHTLEGLTALLGMKPDPSYVSPAEARRRLGMYPAPTYAQLLSEAAEIAEECCTVPHGVTGCRAQIIIRDLMREMDTFRIIIEA